MNKQIFRLAIPNIISNISIPLLGIIDTILMGRLDSPNYLGAVALGGVIFSFIYWGFGFLRMGTTGLTAQAFGKKDWTECTLLLSRAVGVALMAGLVILLAQGAIGGLGFGLLEGDEEVKALAEEYFYIRIWAAPASIGLYAFHGWFLGMQNARYPMLLTILVNAANIAFNLLFITQFDMKADGVAWGTVCAQYIGITAAMGLFAFKYRDYLKHWSMKAMLQLKALKDFFAVNADIFIRTMCLIFVFSFFTSKSAGIDALTLAANQILLQYFHLMAYGVDGFAYAGESLTGRFVGENNPTALRQSVYKLLIFSVGLGLLFALTYLLFGQQMLFLFTDQQPIIDIAKDYLIWMSGISIAGALAFIWDGIYIGATATRPMRNSMLISTFVGFLAVYYLTLSWGNHGLWLSMLVFMVFRGVLLSWLAGKWVLGRLSI